MKTLTKAEEQVMQALWKIGEGFIRDLLDILPEPKPHQNTVATLLKILVEKGFAAIRVVGRQHQYYPLVTKEAYSKASLKTMVKNYFSGSYTDAVSFMVEENGLSLEDLEALIKQIKKGKK
ncbi:BlaI/MecI/CopY family transcriptional regulator [Flaviaesturariibacter amylovorans]|uniref:BlaI/MecI/CopY family transcriptional regulator n=1 Tax=Flaviaesturariibacter amylovorans TaxID=1084520 RepID=A0ABP8HPD3_9BACT